MDLEHFPNLPPSPPAVLVTACCTPDLPGQLRGPVTRNLRVSCTFPSGETGRGAPASSRDSGQGGQSRGRTHPFPIPAEPPTRSLTGRSAREPGGPTRRPRGRLLGSPSSSSHPAAGGRRPRERERVLRTPRMTDKWQTPSTPTTPSSSPRRRTGLPAQPGGDPAQSPPPPRRLAIGSARRHSASRPREGRSCGRCGWLEGATYQGGGAGPGWGVSTAPANGWSMDEPQSPFVPVSGRGPPHRRRAICGSGAPRERRGGAARPA